MPDSAPHSPVSPVAKGDLIAGKYRVGGVIASGGMGVVVEGWHEALDQRVAIKFLLPETAKSPEAKERFVREARAAARIESEHVVRVFDVGMHEGTIPYMVMEYLEGMDLAREMSLRGALTVPEAVERVVQALEAVAEAHAMGIVHRDLKPSNLFLASRSDKNKRRRVKVLDFGISKVAAEALLSASLTSTKSLLGSPGYMSPEQVRNTKGVDPRSDVWSMGVILYELITGEQAYPGESLGDIFAKIREEPLRSIRSLRPEVPAALDAVIAKCLERDRERRYPDAGALREALLPFAPTAARGALDSLSNERPDSRARAAPPAVEAATVQVRPEIQPSGNTISATSSKAEISVSGETPKASSRRLVVGVAALVALGLAVMVVVGLRGSGSASPPLPAAADSKPVPPSSPAEPAIPTTLGAATGEPLIEPAPAPAPAASASADPHGAGPRQATGAKAGHLPSTRSSAPANTTTLPRPATPPPTKKSNDLGI